MIRSGALRIPNPALRIGALALANRRAELAALRFAYENRAAIGRGALAMGKWAARKIQRAWRKRRGRPSNPSGYRFAKRARQGGVGVMRNTTEFKKDFITTRNLQLLNTRTLYVVELTDIEPEATPNAINGREAALANINGWKIRMVVANETTQDLVMNVAFLAPKNSRLVENAGFFRDYGVSRDVDFSTGLNSVQLNHYPISSDKYTVLKRIKRRIRGRGESTSNTQWGSNVTTIDIPFLKLNRQVRYNDDGSTTCENPVWMVKWWDLVIAQPGTPVAPNAAYIMEDVLAVFKDRRT